MTSKSEAAELLRALGFTEHEARAYLALLGAPDMNGYEVAKASGIARANIYPVLERLAAGRAARRVETPKGTRYVGTPPEELLARVERQQRANLAAARDGFAGLQVSPREAPVFNLADRKELFARAREMLDEAQSDLLIALQPPEAAALAGKLAAARARGVEITTLCMEACAFECGGCVGDIHRCCLAPGDGMRWFLMVVDGGWMVAGELHGASTRAIATEQPLVVELAAAYVRQSLALATLGGALGERFEGLVSEKARRILDDLHPEGGFIDWVRHVTADEAS